jgi:DNA repair exonuclease SbcCD ATPase subunit
MENQTTEPLAGDEPKTFDADYVKKLRDEAAKYRTERNTIKEQLDEAAKKSAEYDALIRKQQEEQGNYKSLYEEAQAKLAEVEPLKNRINIFEQTISQQLETVKKTMTDKQIELLEKLPPVMTIEQRLQWAQELAGSKPEMSINEPRPGGGSALNEPIMEEFKKSGITRRAEILNAAKVQNPKLYEMLTSLK